MTILTHMGDFLLGQWLWSVTWDWYHIPINIVLMCLAFNWILRLTIIPSAFLAILANLYAFIVYFALVVGGLMYLLNFSYDPYTASPYTASDPLHACIYLGLIYTILQATFFLLIQTRYKINIPVTLALTLICNVLTAFIVCYVVEGSMI